MPIALDDTIGYNYVPMSEEFRNILIIKPSSLGDVVMTLPALTALRNGFPDAKITWLIRPEFAPLIQNHPHVNDIILFDRRVLANAWFQRSAAAALLRLIQDIRRRRFDAVFDFQGLFRSAAIARLSGCKNRFGMKDARELAHLFYTHRVARDTDSLHVVDHYLRMTRITGVPETTAQFVLPIDPAAAAAVNDKLVAHDVNADSYAVFIPGSAHAYKCWPTERFAALADSIHLKFGFSIVATGAIREKSIVENIRQRTGAPVADFVGLTSMPELVALLKSAKLVVGNDTGPGHIAAALGVPLVIIFGRSNPARIFPYGRPQCVAAVEPFERGTAINNYEPKYDIKAVTTDEVFNKACKQVQPATGTAK